jgi:hypothetical protein
VKNTIGSERSEMMCENIEILGDKKEEKNHIIGYYPNSSICATVFNFDYHFAPVFENAYKFNKKVSGQIVTHQIVLLNEFKFFNYCPICGEIIDKSNFISTISKYGHLVKY